MKKSGFMTKSGYLMKSGFTMIELMVVIVIMVLVSGLSLIGIRSTQRQSDVKMYAEKVRNVLLVARADSRDGSVVNNDPYSWVTITQTKISVNGVDKLILPDDLYFPKAPQSITFIANNPAKLGQINCSAANCPSIVTVCLKNRTTIADAIVAYNINVTALTGDINIERADDCP